MRYGAPQPDGSDGYRQDRYTKLPTKRFNYNAGLDFDFLDVRFGKGKNQNFISNIAYTFAQSHEQGERTLWRLDQLPGWDATTDSLGSWDRFEGLLRPVAGDLDAVIDADNTYRTTEDRKNHTLTFLLRYWHFPSDAFFMASLPVDFRRSHIDDYRALTPRQLTRHDILFQPHLLLKIKKFNLTYKFSPAVPSLLHLLDVRDDSNPLYVSYGNSALRNTKTHNLRAGYNKSYSLRQRSFYVNASYNKVNDQVSIAQTYDRATGRRTSMPLNVDGTWGTSLGAGYGQTLDRADKLYFNISTNAGLTHNVGFLSDTEVLGQGRQAVDNLLWDGNLELDYRITDRTRLTGRADFSWRHMDSDRPDFATLRTTDFSYSLELTTQLPGRIDLWTDITMTSRRGYLDASMNDDCLVWNASSPAASAASASGWSSSRAATCCARSPTCAARSTPWDAPRPITTPCPPTYSSPSPTTSSQRPGPRSEPRLSCPGEGGAKNLGRKGGLFAGLELSLRMRSAARTRAPRAGAGVRSLSLFSLTDKFL